MARRSSIFTHFSSPQDEGDKQGSLFTHSQGENPNGIGEHNLNLQEGTSFWQARGLRWPSNCTQRPWLPRATRYAKLIYTSEQFWWHIWPTFSLNFLCNFHRRCLSTLSIPWCKKSKMTKNSNQGGSCLKVARDSCDVTHSLKQASVHTSHVHASKSCTKYSLHLVQSTSTY